jgi:tight adherence protein B
MLPILAAVLAFITIGGLGWAFVGGEDSSDRRPQARPGSSAGRKRSAAAKKAAASNTPEARRKQIVEQLRSPSRRTQGPHQPGGQAETGRPDTNVRTFWIISAVLGVFALLLPLLFGPTSSSPWAPP